MKTFKGKVISTKMPKTAVVAVEGIFAHPLYEKRVKRHKKYHVHDDIGVSEGNIVRFVETRPISKTKKWKIIEIIRDKE